MIERKQRMSLNSRISLCKVLVALTVFVSGTQSVVAQDTGGAFNALIENDVVSGTDQHYTNGLEFSYLSEKGKVPESLRKVGAAMVPGATSTDVEHFGVALGQDIFTPQNLETTAPLPNERPYAGWLYLGLSLVTEHKERELETWVLNLGVVGPSAGAEQVQNEFHARIGSRQANGWANQLHDELGGVLIYEHRWRNLWPSGDGQSRFDLSPHVGFSVGNIATYANAGLTLRFGDGMQYDYGVPRIRPSLAGSAFFKPTPSGLRWYAFLGVDARAVARNIFLDGNTNGASLSVEKKTYVVDSQAGLALVWRRTRIAYTYVYRTKEYFQQTDADRFGSLSLSYHF